MHLNPSFYFDNINSISINGVTMNVTRISMDIDYLLTARMGDSATINIIRKDLQPDINFIINSLIKFIKWNVL